MADIPQIDASDAERKLLETVWGERELGIKIPIVPGWRPDAIHETLEAIKNNIYPFLQIVNVRAPLATEAHVKFVYTSAGWVIYDYGFAMSSSPPHEYVLLLEKAGLLKENEGVDDETQSGSAGDAGEGENTPGTIIKQQADVAELMIELAKEKGWDGAELVAGTTFMKKYAWIAAKMLGFNFTNYTASDNDYRTLERVKTLKKQSTKRPAIIKRPRFGKTPMPTY